VLDWGAFADCAEATPEDIDGAFAAPERTLTGVYPTGAFD
jgi:hypothetical protein